MTDEERKQLRKVARDDRMKRPDRMGDRKGWKGQKPQDRPRAQPDPKSEIE
jgi:hypothetical protein